MQFTDVNHHATERPGMSGRAMCARGKLQLIRKAMREGRIGYEQARLVARDLFRDACGAVCDAEKRLVPTACRAPDQLEWELGGEEEDG